MGWYEKLDLAYRESASLDAFRKRLYQEINLLLFIRLLNAMTEKNYPKKAVLDQLHELLIARGIVEFPHEPCELLLWLRTYDKSRGNRIIF